MTNIRKALTIGAIVLFASIGFAAPALAEECCQGYCACRDWQTGGTFNGCQITYDAQGNITDVQCGYVVVTCC